MGPTRCERPFAVSIRCRCSVLPPTPRLHSGRQGPRVCRAYRASDPPSSSPSLLSAAEGGRQKQGLGREGLGRECPQRRRQVQWRLPEMVVVLAAVRSGGHEAHQQQHQKHRQHQQRHPTEAVVPPAQK